jgi:hypothetical protein
MVGHARTAAYGRQRTEVCVRKFAFWCTQFRFQPLAFVCVNIILHARLHVIRKCNHNAEGVILGRKYKHLKG